MAEPTLRPFFSAAADFATGRDSPLAYLERCLAAVDAYEPQVGAFVHLQRDVALRAAHQAAKRWREGAPLSRIDGMPVGIKDIIETADMPTQNGSPVFEGWHSHRDAASVAALREAGAVILGKTVTTEFAATTPRGTRNPWDVRRTPGGSSSGSAAAVACGMLPVGLGTQVIGSILRPASFCGCYGFKPSVGAINRGGSHDGLSQSAHGPIAASLEDAWITAYEIAARVGGDPGFPALEGPAEPPAARRPGRLAVLQTPGWVVAGEAAKREFAALLERLHGAGIRTVDAAGHAGLAALERLLERANPVSRQINGWESIWPLQGYALQDASRLSQSLRERIAEARAMRPADYRDLLAERDRARAAWASLAAECDAAVTLSAPGPAPLGLESTGNPAFNVPASYLGVPALTVPVLRAEGLPLGLQLIGRMHADADLFALACWLGENLMRG
jgi:Asp-tRNA(Asn)/Glu-tRNA(Gln) amidotransferase A subunit family amidase